MNDSDPYRPPDADIAGAGRPEARPARGILAGLLVDWAGTIALSIILAIVYGAMLAARGMSRDNAIATLESAGTGSVFGLLNTVAGLSMSFLGGWTCVRVARSPSLGPPAIVASLGALFGFWLSSAAVDLGVNLMLGLFGASATMIGAWLSGQSFRAPT